jgi:Sec-independent protein translocase protein TatA
MKNPSIYIIIALVLIIIFLCFILFFGKGKFDKEIKEYKQDIITYKQDIKKLKEAKELTDKQLAEMPKEKIIIKYKEVVKEKKEAIEISENCIKSLEQATEDLNKCNKALKRKDKIILTGIVGIGADSEWNLIGQAGGTISGKIYSGLFLDAYIGGGATYLVRTDFDKTVHGVCPIFQTMFKIGK